MKAGFERSSQANNRGFGFGHDGSGGSLVEFLGTHVRAAIGTGASESDRRDLAAFVLSWNTGMHPAVGAQATVDGSAASRARRDALLAIAQSDLVVLVAKFVVGGVERGVVYGEGAFASDIEMETHTIASLDALARRGTRVTYTLVTHDAAERWLDRDGDGHRDGDERARCTDPADPRSFPGAACLADLDRDGAVNGGDLAVMLNNWGESGGVGDIDCSGAVDGADLALLLNAWGGCGW
jgi:hypothetical protein